MNRNDRIIGYDVARSLALLGMIVVHFCLVMAADPDHPRWAAALLALLDGRAAALFMVLAGVGVSLMTRHARDSHDPAAIRRARWTLVRRGVFLFALGCLNLAVWPGDILRVYGVTFLIAALFVRASPRTLLGLALGFAAGFILLFLGFDFEEHWEWETLTYRNLWTPAGFVRNLVYDGFRSVFPWAGFLLGGMALGRLNLADRALNRRAWATALAVLVTTELLSWLIVMQAPRRTSLTPEDAQYLFGTASMPALPLFLSAAASTAVFVIALCVQVGQVPTCRGLLDPIAASGRMALTWYLAHIVFGLGAIVLAEQDSRHSTETAILCGLGFYSLTVVASRLWLHRFRQGPVEWVMRTTCG